MSYQYHLSVKLILARLQNNSFVESQKNQSLMAYHHNSVVNKLSKFTCVVVLGAFCKWLKKNPHLLLMHLFSYQYHFKFMAYCYMQLY